MVEGNPGREVWSNGSPTRVSFRQMIMFMSVPSFLYQFKNVFFKIGNIILTYRANITKRCVSSVLAQVMP